MTKNLGKTWGHFQFFFEFELGEGCLCTCGPNTRDPLRAQN